jgi:hypothetical protein
MIAASFLGIFVIPPLYVLFQSLRERAWGLMGGKGKRREAAEPAGTQEHMPAE